MRRLLAAAESGKLSDPAVLQGQVKRMMADPRARNLATNFGYQWLQLRATEGVHPDPVIFTDFDASLRDSVHQRDRVAAAERAAGQSQCFGITEREIHFRQ